MTRMSWNYRVTRQTGHGVELSAIREAYYEGDGREMPHGWFAESVEIKFESLDDFRDFLKLMFVALDKPVLNLSDNGNVIMDETGKDANQG
jgi:hypothetical protein